MNTIVDDILGYAFYITDDGRHLSCVKFDPSKKPMSWKSIADYMDATPYGESIQVIIKGREVTLRHNPTKPYLVQQGQIKPIE